MPPMKRMPTVMRAGKQFATVPTVHTARSVFDRSHGYKTTFDGGDLVPFLCDKILPGDTFTGRVTAIVRLNTPIKPLMDNAYFETFFYFCPIRLIWLNFVKFMGEQVNPGDSIAFTVPQYNGMPAAGYAIGTLYDYFGLPTAGTPAVTASISHSTLPIRAYCLIWNQWFRDENLQSSQSTPTGDGPDTTATYPATFVPLKRGKRPDYFTAALPFLQKGTAVSLPLGTTAPVKGIGWTTPGGTPSSSVANIKESSPLPDRTYAFGYALNDPDIAATLHFEASTGVAATTKPMIYADLSQSTAATINDLRQAIGIQQFLERDARGGTRYTELIFSHFGVKSPDARLQRTEYLGGGSTPIIVSPVAQTTSPAVPTNKDALANLGAAGAGMVSGHGFTKSFTEHGLLIGLMNCRADLTYSQGISRQWTDTTRYDEFWPVLEELGEQAVYNREIFATGGANDALVFGYNERYGPYRFKHSLITGLFRPTASGTLEMWHLSEKFGSLPTLGNTFIQEPLTSVLATRVAVNTEPDFYVDMFIDLKCARPMRVRGVPGLHRL